ncbi:MAG: hypothetical protein GY765_24170 [bacterium]|nr:hypothetical protein [bacterium]
MGKLKKLLVLRKVTISNLNTGMMVGIKGGVAVTNLCPSPLISPEDQPTAASRRCPTDFTCPSGGRAEA